MLYRSFIEKGFLIDRADTGELVPFKFNPIQNEYYDDLVRDYDIEKKGLTNPIRENILKARREGFSSLILALFCADDIWNDNPTETLVLSYKSDATAIFLKRYRTYALSYFAKRAGKTQEDIQKQPGLLDRIAKQVLSVDGSDIVFAHNGAHFSCGTASARVGGRGGVLQKLLFSEMAYYPDTELMTAKEIIEGTMRQVDISSGWVFGESTENGRGTYQHRLWVNVKRGISRFKNRFFGAGKFYSPEQLEQIKSEFVDMGMFRREYPMTENDLFASSSLSFTTEEEINALVAYEHATKGIIYWLSLKGVNYIDQCELLNGALEMLVSRYSQSALYAGIDIAKQHDRTVLTVLKTKAHAMNPGVKIVSMDATGSSGDFMPDWFERNTRFYIEKVRFSRMTKDIMYTNLTAVIKGKTTSLPTLVEDNEFVSEESELFMNEMIELQKKVVGEIIVVSHPAGDESHDDFCFIASTKVLTRNGNVKIEEIKLNDEVMTRNGYKKVIRVGNRLATTIKRFGITGTADHPFFTTNGIKRFDSLHVSDILYIWNEKQLSIEEKSITEILNLCEGNTDFIFGNTTNQKRLLLRYIDRYGLITLVKYLKDSLYTTKTAIRSIMNYQILEYCHEVNISQYTPKNQPELLNRGSRLKLLERKQKNGMGVKKVLRGIKSMLKQVFTAQKVLRVYNLQIEDEHEYFANNILVHNCDSWALAEHGFSVINGVQKREKPVGASLLPNPLVTMLNRKGNGNRVVDSEFE